MQKKIGLQESKPKSYIGLCEHKSTFGLVMTQTEGAI